MTSQRRKREWQDFFIDEVTADGEIDQEQLTNQGLLEVKGYTLVRMIIRLDVIADAIVEASTDSMVMSLGIGTVFGDLAETSASLNVGAEKDVPVSGWLWRTRLIMGEQWQSMVRINEDIRAQRKIMYGQPRILISSSLNSGVAFTVETVGLVRCLYLLP